VRASDELRRIRSISRDRRSSVCAWSSEPIVARFLRRLPLRNMSKLVHRRTLRAAVVTMAIVGGFSSSAFAGDDDDPRWGVTIWGLSYHVNKSIDYAADNWGVGLRY